MNFSEKDYQQLSSTSYWVDKQHPENTEDLIEGTTIKINGKKVKILKVTDNTENGMQAMAVAPIDKNGNVDTSQVIIAYAGTNFDDYLDVATDAQTVGLSSDTLTTSEKVFSGIVDANHPSNNYITQTNTTDAQSITALQFAEETKKLYPNSSVSTTGHSLGEYLALMVAAENKWLNVGFNGPDPYGILSAEAKAWLKENSGMLTNYRNRGDAIGNLMGNGTNAEIKISLYLGLNPFKGVFHSLSTWTFDKEGNLIIPKNDYNTKATQQQAEHYLMTAFVRGVYTLGSLKHKFQSSGGGISTSEQIYLDDSQALAVVKLASSEFELVMSDAVKIYQDGIKELETLWQKTKSKALTSAPDLSHSDVMAILEASGASERIIVTLPSELFRTKIAKAKKMSEEFKQLVSEIKGKIAELVQRDQELARQLG